MDADSGIIQTVVATPANATGVVQAHALLHGAELNAFGDADYQGVDDRHEHRGQL